MNMDYKSKSNPCIKNPQAYDAILGISEYQLWFHFNYYVSLNWILDTIQMQKNSMITS